jgi:hypothetical protein
MSTLIHVALFVPAFMTVVALCTCFQRRLARRSEGWSYLTPGPFTWLGMGSGLVISAVGTLVAAAGKAPVPVAVFFVLVTLALALHIIIERVRWNGERVERRTMLLQDRRLFWNELSRFGVEPTGYYWISGFAQPRIRFSPYDNGFDQLMAKVARHLPDNSPPAETVPKLEFALARIRSR